MTLREEIAQGVNVALVFKEARPKDSHKYLKTVGAFANGRGWRMVSDTNAANLGERNAVLRSDGVLAVEPHGHVCQRTTARTPSLRRVLREIGLS